MKQSDKFRENAANCGQLADAAADAPVTVRYRRMQKAWLDLADNQDWLDGKMPDNEKPRHPEG